MKLIINVIDFNLRADLGQLAPAFPPKMFAGLLGVSGTILPYVTGYVQNQSFTAVL